MITWNNIELIKPKQGQNILLFCGNFYLPQPYGVLISGTYEIEDDEEYYETDYGHMQLSDYPHWSDFSQLNLPKTDEYYTYFVYREYQIYDICYSSVKLEMTSEDTGEDGYDYDTRVELIMKNGSKLITPISYVFKTKQPNMKTLNYKEL